MLGILQRAAFYLRKTLNNIRSTMLITLITVSTTAVALFILSLFVLFSQNALALSELLKHNIQISAYFNENVSEENQQKIRMLIESFEGVTDVEHVTTAKAREYFLQRNTQMGQMIKDFSLNPFPASLEIRVSREYLELPTLDRLVQKLRKLPYFDDIVYGRTWTEHLLGFLALVQGLGLFIGILLLVAVTFILNNTISLSLFAKREELHIVALVGASRTFIYLPFQLEAVLVTTTAGVIALAATWAVFRGMAGGLNNLFGYFTFHFLPWYSCLAIVLGAGLLGFLGCSLSLLRYRKGLE